MVDFASEGREVLTATIAASGDAAYTRARDAITAAWATASGEVERECGAEIVMEEAEVTVPGASLLDDEEDDEDVDRDLELSDLEEWDSDNEDRPRLDISTKSVKRVSAWKQSRANQESQMIEQVTEGLKHTIRAAKSKGPGAPQKDEVARAFQQVRAYGGVIRDHWVQFEANLQNLADGAKLPEPDPPKTPPPPLPDAKNPWA